MPAIVAAGPNQESEIPSGLALGGKDSNIRAVVGCFPAAQKLPEKQRQVLNLRC